MPDSESNDTQSASKRPKRHAAQRANAYLYNEQSSVFWSEEKELNKALLASLQDAKRNHKSNTYCDASDKSEYSSCAVGGDAIDETGICSKLNNSGRSTAASSDAKDGPSMAANGDSKYRLLQSLARRARIPAQRKFAQGSNNNSPMSTPFKVGVAPAANVVELFPNQRPKTEDFLTFLCLRRSPTLPPNLDFISMSHTKSVADDKADSDSDISLVDDECETPIADKYSAYRIANSDRRGSASSNASKSTSLSSKASLTVKKSELSVDSMDKRCKRMQNKCDSNHNLAKRRDLRPPMTATLLPQPILKQSHSRRSSPKLPPIKEKPNAYAILKEKYKQQLIDRKTANPSNHLKCIKKKDMQTNKDKRSDSDKQLEGIQTRQRLRNYCFKQQVEDKANANAKRETNASNISQRVLRSHHSSICTHSLSSLSTALLMHRVNRKSKQFNASQVGVRPQKRKAKPVVPLIDYHFMSDSDSDSNRKIKSNRKKVLQSSTPLKTKFQKSVPEDNRFKGREVLAKTCLNASKAAATRPPGRPKGSTKERISSAKSEKAKTSLNCPTRRLTRSSQIRISPPKDAEALEKERLIKKKIIEIEKKHKRLRRFPSDASLHSSTSSTSSSSESLPNSSSSSSSINLTRVTRSLEHLKSLRDFAANLKKQQKNKDEKNKSKSNDQLSGTKKKRQIPSKSPKRVKNSDNISKFADKKNTFAKMKNIATNCGGSGNNSRPNEYHTASDTDCGVANECALNDNDDSTADFDLHDEMERASSCLQDMADEINTLDDMTDEVVHSVPDLVYCNTEHIQGLMTSEFSGAFSEETVTTASAMLLPSSSASYHYSQSARNTVDASTNTTEDDILECLTSGKLDYKLSVGTQTITPANSPLEADTNKCN